MKLIIWNKLRKLWWCIAVIVDSEFNFDPKFYNVVEVSQYEYEQCTSIDVVKVFNSSPAIVALNERGVFFFICNISNYCWLGQKMAITVHHHHSNSSHNPPSPLPSLPPLASPPSSPPTGLSPHPGTTVWDQVFQFCL